MNSKGILAGIVVEAVAGGVRLSSVHWMLGIPAHSPLPRRPVGPTPSGKTAAAIGSAARRQNEYGDDNLAIVYPAMDLGTTVTTRHRGADDLLLLHHLVQTSHPAQTADRRHLRDGLTVCVQHVSTVHLLDVLDCT
ncbi:hypothetical protein OIV42_32845, partial [Burkholderia pseudomallei]|nr:hypothetical protein [Burkholderia pseudomallei]